MEFQYEDKLLNYLPDFYHRSDFVNEIMNSDSLEIIALYSVLKELDDNFRVDTATWGLDYFERELGLKVDHSKSYEERREAVKSKKRGQGTATKEMISNVVNSYTNGAVEIIEQPGNYHFVIKFIGVLGMPKNMDDVTKIIEEIKPAHLNFSFEFKYNTHSVLSKFTYGQLSNYTYNGVREEVINA